MLREGGDIMKEVNQAKTNEQKTLSVKNLQKNPRLAEIKLEDEKFFAYEKQRAHN